MISMPKAGDADMKHVAQAIGIVPGRPIQILQLTLLGEGQQCEQQTPSGYSVESCQS